jgi:FtsP/CotA-like multicopper oxidase with cupredoxin domain
MRQGAWSALIVMVVALVSAGGAGAAELRVVGLPLRNGQLPEDQRVVRVRQGDDVTLRWTTDRPLTVHLHGYDLEQKLSAGAPVLMRFTARATGRFAIEIHGPSHSDERTVGYLEVHPR